MEDQHKVTARKPFLERMKEKWGLNSLFQVVLIILVFAATGTTVVFIRPFIFKLLGIQDASGWMKTISYLLLVFPLYQILLLAYGFLLGQFEFFWEKEKKLVKGVLRLLRVRKD